MNNSPQERAKQQAAAAALKLVKDGMLLGIGSGSTVNYFIAELGKLVARGFRLRGVATSKVSAELARGVGIELQEEIDQPVDLTIDGADEIAPNFDVIKGRGGALLREKLLAMSSKQVVIIADETKLVPKLGRDKLPVEIVPFLWQQTAERITKLGCSWQLRGGLEAPTVTDNGNFLLDLYWPTGIDNLLELAVALKAEAGVVEHGLFLGLVSTCIIVSIDC